MSQHYESAPQAPPEPAYSSSGPSGPRAGFWQRAGALIIDVLVLAIPTVILYLIDPNLGNFGGLVIGAIYFTVMDGGPKGQTIGKRVLGIRVYDLRQGGPIGYGRGFIRWLVMDLLSWIFLLGYLWMLWDKEKQCWHDKAAGSVVVPVDAYR
jgi:uncharacterized RDD family membrane protein YckC